MFEVFHVSDLHFGKSENQNRNSLALLQGILKLYPFEDSENRYLLVTGDFTHRAGKKEYQFALEALLPFKDRIFVTPGNHDYGSLLGTNYSKRKARYFDTHFAVPLGFTHPFTDKKVFSCQLDEPGNRLMIIGLSSCTKDIFDFAQGEIGDRQRTELAELLEITEPQIPKLVYLHHIPHKDAELEFIMTLRDRRELMAIVSGKVDALAFGHQGKKVEMEMKRRARFTLPGRPMQVRTLPILSARGKKSTDRQCIILDADRSVNEQAFYHITVENNRISATVEKIIST